jgi:hypothetical protein
MNALVRSIRPDIQKEPAVEPFNRRPAGVDNITMFDLYAKGERGPLDFFPARARTVLAQLSQP